MKAYTYFMAVFSTLILLVLGVFALLYYFGTLSPQLTEFLTGNGKWVFAVVGVVFILLALGEIYTGGKSLTQEPAVSFSNPLGEVKITYSALEDYIRRVAQSSHEILHLKPKVREGRQGLEVEVRVVVTEEVNIPRMTGSLQDLILRNLKESIGIENVAQVKVHVSKIASPKRREREIEEESI